ncbi:MAG: hypothetical protein ACW964_17175, partial [Candidatus Hodarchaeales archaeon]
MKAEEFNNLMRNKSLQKEYAYDKKKDYEEWIGSFLLSDGLLLISTNECMELDEDCSLNIWEKKGK